MLTQELRSTLSRALEEEYSKDDYCPPWLIDFDQVGGFIIAELKIDDEWGTYKLTYTLVEDPAEGEAEATFGEPVALERRYVLKGTTTVVATKLLEGSTADEVLAEIIAGNPAYAGVSETPNGNTFVVDLALLETTSKHIGTKFVLRAAGAEAAMKTMAGKPVHMTEGFLGHFEAGRPPRVIGTMLGGKVVNNDAGIPVVRCAGLLWDRDFPAEIGQIKASKALLGASWEIEYPRDTAKRLDDDTVELSQWTYTGAAILLKKAAAFPDTAVLRADRATGATLDAAELTVKQRNALPDSDFAVIQKTKTGLKVRKLPIHDEAHRLAAWSRVNQKGTDLTDAERSKARDRIMSRAKSKGDDWAKGYTKKGSTWVKGKGKETAMATRYASYSLPEGTDESVIAQIVKDALTEMESGKELEALKASNAALVADKDKLTLDLAAMATTVTETTARATKAETEVAELKAAADQATATIAEFEAAKAAAELRITADAWWAEFSKKNGLTQLAQAEVDKRRPVIEKAAQDQPLTTVEWTQLTLGARSGSASSDRPASARKDPPIVVLAEMDTPHHSGISPEELRKKLPALNGVRFR